MNNVNLKQLAQELGLAISTVSRALRDSHEISQETKDRVQALATKLGFQPNPHASSLRRNKSRTIAVIVPEIENNFFSQAINGVELIAQQKGYHVLIYLTHENVALEKDFLQLLRNGRVDGLMIGLQYHYFS
jgi:LacI family transcriptional regulator